MKSFQPMSSPACISREYTRPLVAAAIAAKWLSSSYSTCTPYITSDQSRTGAPALTTDAFTSSGTLCSSMYSRNVSVARKLCLPTENLLTDKLYSLRRCEINTHLA